MRMAAIRTVGESFRGDRSTILATSVALFGIVFAFVGATSAIFRNQSRRHEEETTAWFEQALDLHCIADATGRFVRINEAFTRVLGHHKDEFQARLGSRRSTSPPARASTTYSTVRTGQCSWRSGE